MKLLKGEAYELSLAAIRENRVIVEKIGEPMEPGWFVSGTVQTTNAEGKAKLEYSLTGPNSPAKVYVYASRKMGKWKLIQVIVTIKASGEQLQVIQQKRE